ncbi:hypothetical protein D1007_45075 [Hordeum vulgare]|nr:hypothetical protein D1007_45075 [Hordeum vulgare]
MHGGNIGSGNIPTTSVESSAPLLRSTVGHPGPGVHRPRAGDHSGPGAHLPCVGGPPLPPALMAARSRSPESVSSAFPRPRPVVSGLGLSGSPSARSSSNGPASAKSPAAGPTVPGASAGWNRAKASRKALWRRRKAQRRV